MNKEEKEAPVKVKLTSSKKGLYIISGVVLILVVVASAIWYSHRANSNIKTIPAE